MAAIECACSNKNCFDLDRRTVLMEDTSPCANINAADIFRAASSCGCFASLAMLPGARLRPRILACLGLKLIMIFVKCKLADCLWIPHKTLATLYLDLWMPDKSGHL